MDAKQLNTIMKIYYFYNLKALQDGKGKIKMHYGMSKVKKQLLGKRPIAKQRGNNKITAILPLR